MTASDALGGYANVGDGHVRGLRDWLPGIAQTLEVRRPEARRVLSEGVAGRPGTQVAACTIFDAMSASSQAALKALSEPRRVAMLRLVRDRPRSVGEIAGHFEDITQQAVSQHLRELREAGLVAVHKDGQRRLYVVRPEGLAGLESFLRDLWPSSLERLKQAVEEAGAG